MKRLKKIGKERRGEGYMDIAIGVFCLMLVVALATALFPLFLKKNLRYKNSPKALSDFCFWSLEIYKKSLYLV